MATGQDSARTTGGRTTTPAATDHLPLHETLVVSFDGGEVVEIVHHHAEGFGQALVRHVGGKVDTPRRAPFSRWKRATGSPLVVAP